VRPSSNLTKSPSQVDKINFATIYDVNPLYTAGTDGAGISIALVGRSNIHLDDVATFRAAAGLAANNPAVVLPGTDPGLVKEDQDEATLDVEWAGAVAPAAAVKLVAGASTSSTDGVDLAAAYAVNHLLAQVVSVSYGSCEQAMGSTEMAFYNSLWEQAASEGITAVVASGDSGAAGCEAGSAATGTVAAVNGLCSSPYATCVGGTEFNEGSDATQYWAGTNGKSGATALGYIPETVWNESSANGGMALWASGGGASRVYRQPAWQQEVSGAAAANGMRAVPDVSLTAAGHDGYVTCENGSYWEVSGTSSAAPAFAGVLALVAQAGGKVGLGNANPALYGLVNAPVNPFHATQFGNNSVPGVPGFAAGGTDYNLATGLGSVDTASLVEAWGAGGTTRPALEINAEPGSLLLIPGGTSTVTLHIAASGSFAGSVTLSAAGLPAGVTAEWNGNPVLNGTGTATLTLRASLLASTGTAVVAVTARGGGVSMSSTIPLQVQAPVFHLRGSPVRPVSQRNW
jgi:subtilase family serine protease